VGSARLENEIGEMEGVCRPRTCRRRIPAGIISSIEARGFRVAVFTVLGRTYMGIKADCPFLCADRMSEKTESRRPTRSFVGFTPRRRRRSRRSAGISMVA